MNQPLPNLVANLAVFFVALSFIIFRRRFARSLMRSEEQDPFRRGRPVKDLRTYEVITVLASSTIAVGSVIVFIRNT